MSDQTVEVRIRTEDDTEGKRLCDWPAAALDRVIPTIQSWGLYVSGSDEFSELSGQFSLDDTGAYFEVVASRPDSI